MTLLIIQHYLIPIRYVWGPCPRVQASSAQQGIGIIGYYRISLPHLAAGGLGPEGPS